MAMRETEKAVIIEQCCSLSMRAHSSSSPFLLHSTSVPFPLAIFAFPGSWSAEDWLVVVDDNDAQSPFGDSKIDSSLFPSLRSISNDVAARVNAAFLRSFQRLLKTSSLQAEANRSLIERKQIVFTGHSSGGSISVLATTWLLECIRADKSNLGPPFCVTFGSSLTGDSVFSHALHREGWSQCFLHFVMMVDIVPRVLLAPLSSFRDEFQAFLHLICPRSLCFNLDFVGSSQLMTTFYGIILKNACAISTHMACLHMGCTNSLLGTLSGFIKPTPYRPFGIYGFCTNNGRIIYLKNSDAILQLLFFGLQPAPEQEMLEVAHRSLKDHLRYDSGLKSYVGEENIVYLDGLDAIPLSLNDADSDQMQLVQACSEHLKLSTEGIIRLRAAGQWDKQRLKNQDRIDANFNKIQEALDILVDYRASCDLRGMGYYDTFKLQRDPEDFNVNVKRLELAGLWDEIIEMLRRYELPDRFEGRPDWVKLGTSYRLLVEPLDIANYYRHSKNEDTGSYMVEGRPRRYRYTQRWLQQEQHMAAGSMMESCFWAMVEDLSADSSNKLPFEAMKEKVLELEKEMIVWLTAGRLSREVLLNGSTFMKWWKSLPEQHRSNSCLTSLMRGEQKLDVV